MFSSSFWINDRVWRSLKYRPLTLVQRARKQGSRSTLNQFDSSARVQWSQLAELFVMFVSTVDSSAIWPLYALTVYFEYLTEGQSTCCSECCIELAAEASPSYYYDLDILAKTAHRSLSSYHHSYATNKLIVSIICTQQKPVVIILNWQLLS